MYPSVCPPGDARHHHGVETVATADQAGGLLGALWKMSWSLNGATPS